MPMRYTHSGIQIGMRVKLRDSEDHFTVTDVLDGYNGIGLTKSLDIHSKERFFRDVIAIVDIVE